MRSRRVLQRVQLFDLFDLAILRVYCHQHGIELLANVPADRAAYEADLAACRVEQAARAAGHHLPAVAGAVISRLHADLLERGLQPALVTEVLERRVLERDHTPAFASALERHHAGMRRLLMSPVMDSPGSPRSWVRSTRLGTLTGAGN
ncbi:hypothetical protein [Deinococcus multiflagellatus]|uniref:Uncharacterized protein n=1 Tax=Deinococcus multiflagellatus TaxID=1656887 RepID=A0ABW1ZQB5_9DEIO